MKHIVVSGCSFTNNFRINIGDERRWARDPIQDWTWANWLQDYLKDTHILHNYGTVTHDNKSIVRSIIYKVSDLLKDVSEFTLLDYISTFVTGTITKETFDKLNLKPSDILFYF